MVEVSNLDRNSIRRKAVNSGESDTHNCEKVKMGHENGNEEYNDEYYDYEKYDYYVLVRRFQSCIVFQYSLEMETKPFTLRV